MSDPNPPIYAGMQQPTGGQMQEPVPVNAGQQDDLESRVAAMVAAQLSAVEAKYADRIATLESQLATATAPPAHLVPEHAGGPGLVLAPVWSQWHQELARDGKLTPDILRAVGIAENVIPKILTGLALVV
jgi:hypothetical protein